jgi:dihydroorotase
MEILLSNIFLVHEGHALDGKKVNIHIIDGKFKTISEKPIEVAENIQKIEGGYVSAGFFDIRCTINDPGQEHKEDISSLSKAAQAGGYTQLAVLRHDKPAIQSKDAIQYIKQNSQKSNVDLLPIAAVTNQYEGKELAELIDLHHAGAVAFSDGNHCISNSGVLSLALQYVKQFDGLVLQHAEDDKLTQYGLMHEGLQSASLGLKGMPSLAEELIIMRDLELLQYVDGKIHFSHISTQKSVALIKQAKEKGLSVTCDVAVANLCHTDQALSNFDPNYKVNPPLRTEQDRQALWNGLADGTIDAISTDHHPQDQESKFLEFDLADFGMATLETTFSLLLAHKPSTMSLSTLISKFTNNPRAILKQKLVHFEENSEAIFTIFDPHLEWIYSRANAKTKAFNSPYFQNKLKGKVLATYNQDKLFQL